MNCTDNTENNKNVLFIITARSGSKGVPRKNIRKIEGLPLIAFKINAARNCNGYNKRIIVSTDDTEIADVALKYGAEVPFMRPDYLASDTAGSMDVVEHAMTWVLDNDSVTYDYVCLLEPSSPFATGNDLQQALDRIVKSNADTLLGMKEVEVSTSFIHELDDNGGLSLFYDAVCDLKDVRRQSQAPQYTMNGCMYIAKWDYFMKNKLFHSINSVPYIMPEEKSIEIDSMADYNKACYYAKEGIIRMDEYLIIDDVFVNHNQKR